MGGKQKGKNDNNNNGVVATSFWTNGNPPNVAGRNTPDLTLGSVSSVTVTSSNGITTPATTAATTTTTQSPNVLSVATPPPYTAPTTATSGVSGDQNGPTVLTITNTNTGSGSDTGTTSTVSARPSNSGGSLGTVLGFTVTRADGSIVQQQGSSSSSSSSSNTAVPVDPIRDTTTAATGTNNLRGNSKGKKKGKDKSRQVTSTGSSLWMSPEAMSTTITATESTSTSGFASTPSDIDLQQQQLGTVNSVTVNGNPPS